VVLIASLGLAANAAPQQWDSIRGALETVETTSPHHFLLRGRNIGYLVDGDAGEVEGTLTLSMFSPALRPQPSRNRVYAYGAYYSRTYYGERTDAVTFYDLETLEPVSEVVIPPKSAGIGHSGMIGLVDGRFLVEGLRLRTACDLELVDLKVKRPEGFEVPPLRELEEALPEAIEAVANEGRFDEPRVAEVTFTR